MGNPAEIIQMAGTQLENMLPQMEPEVLLPVQYYGPSSDNTRLSPEQLLSLAVLRDAINVYTRVPRGAQRALQRETEEWFASTDRTWIFSFENICDALEIDAIRLRRILKWRKDSRTSGRGVLHLVSRRKVGGPVAITASH